jgi:putative nucleotidyltransferase with HDIG domain
MKVKEIYEKYKIPPNLQTHQLRVAAIAKIITDAWIGESIDKKAVIEAALFHDMGNLIKFNFDRVMLLEDPDNVEFWRKAQEELIEKYGKDEHHATLEMCKEIGLPQTTFETIENMSWRNIDEIIAEDKWELGILTYTDMRIGPFGVLSVKERIENLVKRSSKDEQYYETYLKNGENLENELSKRVSIDLSSITDQNLEENFELLKNLDI